MKIYNQDLEHQQLVLLRIHYPISCQAFDLQVALLTHALLVVESRDRSDY